MEPLGITGVMTGIGIRLRAVRYAVDAKNLSELCRQLGMEKTSKWQHWEKGRSFPNQSIMLDFKHLYPGITLDYILDDDPIGLAHGLIAKIDAALPIARAEIMKLRADDERRARAKAAKKAKAA